jgi:hypothetical protein
MALLLSRHSQAAAALPTPRTVVRCKAEPALPPAFRRQVFVRTATGPPTGPPAIRADHLYAGHLYADHLYADQFGAYQFCYARTNGASTRPVPPHCFVPSATSLVTIAPRAAAAE